MDHGKPMKAYYFTYNGSLHKRDDGYIYYWDTWPSGQGWGFLGRGCGLHRDRMKPITEEDAFLMIMAGRS